MFIHQAGYPSKPYPSQGFRVQILNANMNFLEVSLIYDLCARQIRNIHSNVTKRPVLYTVIHLPDLINWGLVDHALKWTTSAQRVDSDARQMSSGSATSRAILVRVAPEIVKLDIQMQFALSIRSPKSLDDVLTRRVVATDSTDSSGCCTSRQNIYVS